MRNVFITLVGSNPLPIYVMTTYLLMRDREDKEILYEPNYVIFVFTKDTKKYSNNIKTNITNIKKSININDIKFGEIDLGEKGREPVTIRNMILNKLKQIMEQDNIESINLNYTGGTKVMSVISYNTIKNFCSSQNIKSIFSDLDPNDNRINLEVRNGDKGDLKRLPTTGDLRDYVLLDADVLFSLHDMEVMKQDLNDKLYIEEIDTDKFANKALKLLLKSPSENKESKDFRDANKNLYDFDKKRYTSGVSYNYEKIKKNNKLIEAFEIYNNLFGDIIPYKNINNINNNKLFNVIEYFKGKWLEDYTLIHIKNIKGEVKLNKIYKSVEAKYNYRKCEIDVIALKGYEMHLFTCTTSQHISVVKQKAFEAIYRAEQLAGEHAKVYVICPMYERYIKNIKFSENNNLKELEKDLSSFDALNNKKIKFFSIEDLIDSKNFELKLKFFLGV